MWFGMTDVTWVVFKGMQNQERDPEGLGVDRS